MCEAIYLYNWKFSKQKNPQSVKCFNQESNAFSNMIVYMCDVSEDIDGSEISKILSRLNNVTKKCGMKSNICMDDTMSYIQWSIYSVFNEAYYQLQPLKGKYNFSLNKISSVYNYVWDGGRHSFYIFID